jgi:hypothetical protein
MATTYTKCQIFFGSEAGMMFDIDPDRGTDYINAIVDYPAAATPYFSVVLTHKDTTIDHLASMNMTLLFPG